MSEDLGSVSQKARKLFEKSRDDWKKSIDNFLRGLEQGLKDVDKDWGDRSPKEQQRRFDAVFDVAESIMVGPEGLQPSTFNSYKTIAKKCHVYQVDWNTAKSSSAKTLRTAQRIKNKEKDPALKSAAKKYAEATKKGKLTDADKMALAVQALKDTPSVKVESEALSKVWVLPDVNSENALSESIATVVEYWSQKELPITGVRTPEATAVRKALKELRVYLKKKAVA